MAQRDGDLLTLRHGLDEDRRGAHRLRFAAIRNGSCEAQRLIATRRESAGTRAGFWPDGATYATIIAGPVVVCD